MELIDKANVLAQLWMLDRNNEVCVWADLGMPYAYGIAQGDILDLSAEGEKMVNDAWLLFCKVYNLNVDDDLSQLDVESILDIV